MLLFIGNLKIADEDSPNFELLFTVELTKAKGDVNTRDKCLVYIARPIGGELPGLSASLQFTI